jgi:peptidoglycan/LPS O-acetylase OafA/YrhL
VSSQPIRVQDLPLLTIVRFPAAIWVLLVHTWSCFSGSLPPGPVTNTMERIASQGGLGVAFFFILSGFILTHVYGHQEQIDKRKFLLARFARIWPVYALSLLVAIPLLVGQIETNLLVHGLLGGWMRMIVRAAMSLTFTQAWSPNAALIWSVTAWSLSCEAFFYLLFPWIMPWMRSLNSPRLRWIIAACLIPMVGRFGLYRTIFPSLHLNFNPIVRLPEFIAGIGLGILFSRGTRVSGWIAGLCAAVAVASLGLQSEALWRLVVLHAAFLVGILWLAGRTPPKGTRIVGFLVLLGQGSYSLYLLHATLFEYIPKAWSSSLLGWSACATAVVGLSVATYTWVEAPARTWIVARFGRS